jgi:small multidrug resistance family-3 protein
MALSFFYFLMAGLCEIGGGYLVWLWLKEGRSIWLGLLGGFLLLVYGVIPTFQQAPFGRVYAAYGGIFVVLSLVWGWQIDKTNPDIYDLLGGVVILVGIAIMMFGSRH